MAGPAGGRGGGHRPSGGFSGGNGHHGGGFGYSPYRRGGLFGGLLGLILAPFVIMLVALVFLGVNLYVSITAIAHGGLVVYDNAKLEEFANEAYYAHFTDQTTKEDGIMIFVVVHEDNSEISYLAYPGDNVNSEINNKFASDSTFGKAINDTVNVDSYKFSLSKDLAKVMEIMKTEVEQLNLESSFVKEHDMSKAPESKAVNQSNITVNTETINVSLESFTEQTGIPTIVVIEDAEDIYGRTMPITNIVVSVITLIIVGVCIFFIVRSIRKKKMIDNDLGPSSGGTMDFKLNENSPE